MKTVTIKADAEFDALLNRLARRMSTTRSGVIRDAVRNYQQHLDVYTGNYIVVRSDGSKMHKYRFDP